MAGLAPIIDWIVAIARGFADFSEVSMSRAAAFALVVSASVLAIAPALAQRSTTGSAPPLVQEPGAPPIANAPGAAQPAPSLAPGKTATPANCSNPNALGIVRTVEIDTTGGPGFGFEHFRQ